MTDSWGARLKELAETGDWDGLEAAWLEALEVPEPASTFLGALDVVDPTQRDERALALLPLVLDTYSELNRHEDALAVIRRLGVLKPKEPPYRRALVLHLKGAYGGTDWVDGFLHASKLLEGGTDLREGLERFDSYQPYRPGCGVEHRAGWGVGVIEGFNEDTWDLKIRFDDGGIRELPLSSALESLKPLDAEHLQVMIRTRPDELKALAVEDPACVIRKALALFPGKTLNAKKVKELLVDCVVPAGEWARWWPKAKQAAAKDPFLHVEGGARPVFHLRDKPVTIREEAMENVTQAADLTEAVVRAREYLAAAPGEELKQLILAEVRRRVEAGEEETPVLLEGVLLLEEMKHETPVTATELLREAIPAEGNGSGTAAFFNAIPTEWGRHNAIQAFIEAFPEKWAAFFVRAYPDLPKDALDAVGDVLVKRGFGAALLSRFREIMAAPWKAPWPVYFLSRRCAGKGFEGNEDQPGLPEVALTMLRCLESSLFNTMGNKFWRRELRRRYEELLFDPRAGLLECLVEHGTREEVVRASSMIHITSKIPEPIQEFLRSEIAYRYPDLHQQKEKGFWEEDFIFCTRMGIKRRNSELRDITEVKLPEIFKAIGKAADFGDLSENAEWTAALEEQRLLTEKASQIEEELGRAKAIEDQRRPQGMVVPGTKVLLRRDSGEEETVTILGPWDTGEEGVVSYKAPLAASLLGVKEGARAEVKLPEKSYEVLVVSVQTMELE